MQGSNGKEVVKFFSRKPAATIAIAPGPFRAKDTIAVAITVPETLTGVTEADLELGYVNGFRYLWAGRAEAAASQGYDSILMAGQVGTNYGTEKDAEEWVHVLDAPLQITDGTLNAGTHNLAVRLPSWSPGSSEKVVQWELRLHIHQGRKSIDESAPLHVLVGAPDPVPEMPLIQGERALANSLHFEIETERACYRPGEEVRGIVAVTPREPVTRKALVAAWFQRLQASHPVDKTPGGTTDSYIRPMVTLFKDVQLVQHQRSEFPFALTLPANLDPTTEAVNSSISWFVQIKVEFAGATGAIERAQRGIVVYTD